MRGRWDLPHLTRKWEECVQRPPEEYDQDSFTLVKKTEGFGNWTTKLMQDFDDTMENTPFVRCPKDWLTLMEQLEATSDHLKQGFGQWGNQAKLWFPNRDEDKFWFPDPSSNAKGRPYIWVLIANYTRELNWYSKNGWKRMDGEAP